ncbi:Leucine-responsive regulatory protein [Candidatus Hepatincolaceae symbiont of Richtersius coronifer]
MTKKIKLDKIDLKILYHLQQNGRISNIELSNLVGISASPCLRRLKHLQDQKVIRGIHADLNPEVFGQEVLIFASISIEVKSEKEQDQFETELTKIKEIREIYSLSLQNDYLLKVITKSLNDYKILISTRISKVPFIKKIRTTQITKIVKVTPGFELDI